MSSECVVFQDEGITTTIGSPDTLGYPPLNPSYPRLQKSASDPTDLQSFTRRESAVGGLDRCLSLISVLGNKVDKVTSFISTMPGTCKQCHGETGSEHVGSRWGFEHCNLPHNDGCRGGIEEIPGKRKACPVGFVPTKPVSGNETEVSQQRFSDLETESETESDPEGDLTKSKLKLKTVVSSVPIPSLPNLVHLPSPLANSSSLLGSSLATTGINSLPLMSSGFAPQNAALGGAASMLLGGFASSVLGGVTSQATGLPTAQSPSDLSQSWLLQQYLQQQQALQYQQQQQQAILQDNQRVMKEMQAAVEEAKKAARSAASVRRKSSVSFSDALVSEAEALKSNNSRENVSRSVSNLGQDMNDVRKISGLRDVVEQVMEKDVYSHASLARTPTAGVTIGAGHHVMQCGVPDNSQAAALIAALQAELVEKQKSLDAVLGHSQQKDSKSERKAARRAARADRRTAVEKLAAARTETKLAKRAARKLGVTGLSSSSDSGTESDDEPDLDRTITKNKKLKKKLPVTVTNLGDSSDGDDELPSVLTDDRGRAWKMVGGKLEALPTYVRDPLSGKMIRTTPSASGASCARSGSSSDSSDERKSRKKEKKLRQKSKRAHEKENAGPIQGITPLGPPSQPLPPVPHLQDNRGKSQDTKHSLSVVDWAKMCPIKYASTCTTKNLNLPVFMWARLAELRALNAGALETGLKPGELDARLRHLQCVLELLGTNSILSEYSGYGWQLGRDYDRKVQATMDSGASDWVTFNSMFSLGPHPSFVLSAKDEVEKVTKKTNPQREDDPTKTKKKVCGRFNSCRTAKRCEWELENPNSGRCKRLHQCSYCKLTHSKSVFHQAWDCPSGGKEAVLAGSHSL